MRPKLLVLGVAALNLVAGLSFGFVLGRSSAAVEPVVVHPPDHAMDLASLADALRLPPDRDAKVRAILASCGTRFDEVMKDTRPRLRALHDRILAELGDVLTPAEMDRLADEYRRRHGDRNPLELR